MSRKAREQIVVRCRWAIGATAAAAALTYYLCGAPVSRLPPIALAHALLAGFRFARLLRRRLPAPSRWRARASELPSPLASALVGALSALWLRPGDPISWAHGSWSGALERSSVRPRFPPARQSAFVELKSRLRPALLRAAERALLEYLPFAALQFALFGRTSSPFDFFPCSFALHFVAATSLASFEIAATEPPSFGADSFAELAADASDPTAAAPTSRELLRIARDDARARSRAFELSKPGGHPTNWKTLSGACLASIESFSRRADSIASPPLEDEAVAAPRRAFDFAAELKRELRSALKSIRSGPIVDYLFGTSAEANAKALADEAKTTANACSSLAHLAAASLVEDSYGVVQDDLPIILSALLKLKLSSERLFKSGVVNKKYFKRDRATSEEFNDLKSTVKRSVYLIRIKFDEYIEEIALDEETKAALQPFIDYREC